MVVLAPDLSTLIVTNPPRGDRHPSTCSSILDDRFHLLRKDAGVERKTLKRGVSCPGDTKWGN